MIHEVAIMRFLEANDRFHRAEFSREQAAEYMGVSVSTFYRKRRRFAEEGGAGRERIHRAAWFRAGGCALHPGREVGRQ
jgi:hypothetical protein